MSSRALLKIALLLALLVPALVSAEETLQRPGWSLRVWRTPSDLLGGKAQPLPGSDGQFDAVEFLRAVGATIPEGARAIFDKTSMTLLLFAPDEAVELVETLLGTGRDDEPCDLLFEVSLVECALPRGLSPVGMSYEDLRKGAGASWRERERVATRANTGQTFLVERGRDFAVELEPILGPDGVTFEITLDAQHRGPLSAEGRKFNAHVRTSLKVPDGEPAVAKTWSVGSAKKGPALQRWVALIVRPRWVNSGGWPKKPLKP
jgi:hypothetical protein